MSLDTVGAIASVVVVIARRCIEIMHLDIPVGGGGTLGSLVAALDLRGSGGHAGKRTSQGGRAMTGGDGSNRLLRDWRRGGSRRVRRFLLLSLLSLVLLLLLSLVLLLLCWRCAVVEWRCIAENSIVIRFRLGAIPCSPALGVVLQKAFNVDVRPFPLQVALQVGGMELGWRHGRAGSGLRSRRLGGVDGHCGGSPAPGLALSGGSRGGGLGAGMIGCAIGKQGPRVERARRSG